MNSKEVDNQFIESHRPLVTKIARRTMAQLGLTCDLEDLIGFGFAGLLEARERFDDSRGAQFSTFAYYRIRGAVLDGVRKMAYLPRRAHQKLIAAETADRVAEEVGASRSDNFTRQPQDIPKDEALELHEALQRISATFVLSCLGQDEQENHQTPEKLVITATEAERLRRLLPQLPDREQALIRGYYFEGRQFDEVARSIGISKSWASRLHSKALDTLRQALGGH